MLTRVPTKCLSQHCVKASILQQVSCSWVTSCTCQGTPINAAAMHFPKVSHGLCVPLGPDDGHAFWQRGVSIQQIFLWLHRPVGWHLCEWCSNASVQTGLPSKSVQHSLVRFFPTWHFLLQAGVTASEDTSIKGSIDAFFCMIKNCRGVQL